MAVLNSTPEVLLRRRKVSQQKHLQLQEERRKQKEAKGRNKTSNLRVKFLRAETVLLSAKVEQIENKRVDHLANYEKQRISTSKTEDVKPQLYFVIRIPNQKYLVSIPKKVSAILQILRLEQPNTGVFVNVTNKTLPLLKLISPYIACGKPSLNSIRKLFQKRAKVSLEEGPVTLDNNQLVEDKFGDLGLVCIEDIIHEYATLGENFKAINAWIAPFELKEPVNGWSPLSQLERLRYKEETARKADLKSDAKLKEIDIDQCIEEQN